MQMDAAMCTYPLLQHSCKCCMTSHLYFFLLDATSYTQHKALLLSEKYYSAFLCLPPVFVGQDFTM